MMLQSSCLFSDIRTLSNYKENFRHLLEDWQGNTDPSRDELGDRGSLSSCHSDIGIPINFRQESGIVTFWSIELRFPLEVSKGCEVSCPDEAET